MLPNLRVGKILTNLFGLPTRITSIPVSNIVCDVGLASKIAPRMPLRMSCGLKSSTTDEGELGGSGVESSCAAADAAPFDLGLLPPATVCGGISTLTFGRGAILRRVAFASLEAS